MILTALAAVAATATAPPPAPPPMAEPMPNFFHQPARCGALHDQIVRRQNTSLKGHPRGLQYAVMRQVDGCGLSSPVGYHPDYLLPGHADAPQFRPVDDRPDPGTPPAPK